MDESTRYVWLDEDGERASPRHTSLRSALNFKKMRTTLKPPHPNYDPDWSGPKVHSDGSLQYSLKLPAHLKKLIITEELHNLDAEEEQAVELIMKYGG